MARRPIEPAPPAAKLSVTCVQSLPATTGVIRWKSVMAVPPLEKPKDSLSKKPGSLAPLTQKLTVPACAVEKVGVISQLLISPPGAETL